MGYRGTVADGRFNLNITSLPVPAHRTHGILVGKGPAVECRFPSILELEGAVGPRENGLARQCPLVSHSEDNEEGSDDLFINVIRERRFKFAVCQGRVRAVRT